MDNCSGQNKNQMVIKRAAYMVEAAMFQKVNLIFFNKRAHKKHV